MFNRYVVFALLFGAVVHGGCESDVPDLTAATIQNVGLSQTSSVPPLGEAVAPVTGYPGAGAAVVTSVGGWTGGPGAVTWHGGQWLMAYPAQPGQVLQNVACDVVPNSTSTDLVELVSSNGQILGSNTVPAVTGVVIRTWIVLTGGHPLIDGEQVVLRHSPKDSMTGAWTGPAQDMTVISCAINTTTGVLHTIQYPIDLGSATTWQDGQTLGNGGAKLVMGLGDEIVAVRARVQDTGTTRLAVALQRVAEGMATTVATSAQSLGNGTKQTLGISGLTETVASGQTYQVVIQRPVGTDNCFSWWIEVDSITQ